MYFVVVSSLICFNIDKVFWHVCKAEVVVSTRLYNVKP